MADNNQLRTVISKSSKRKMTNKDNKKANDYTQMVVTKTPIGKGKFSSKTTHEKRSKD